MLGVERNEIDFDVSFVLVLFPFGSGGMRAMASFAERRISALPLPRQVNWRGRSGRFYALTPERLESFALATDGLYLLARGTLPLWVGTARDVIHDADS